jgi:hypothetical protein
MTEFLMETKPASHPSVLTRSSHADLQQVEADISGPW